MIYLDKNNLKMNNKFIIVNQEVFLNEGIDSFLSDLSSGKWLKEREFKDGLIIVKAKAKYLEEKIREISSYFENVKKTKSKNIKNAIDSIGDLEEGKIADIIELTDGYIEKNKKTDIKYIRPDKAYSTSIFNILMSINNFENKISIDTSPKQIAEKFDIDLQFISYNTKDYSGKLIPYDAVSYYKQLETKNSYAKYLTPHVEKLNNVIKTGLIHNVQSSNVDFETFLNKAFKLYDNYYMQDSSKRALLPITNLKKFYEICKATSFNINLMSNEMWKQQSIVTDGTKIDLTIFIEQILQKETDIVKRTVEKYVGEVYYKLFNIIKTNVTHTNLLKFFDMIVSFYNENEEFESTSTQKDNINLFKNCMCLFYTILTKRPKFIQDGSTKGIEKLFETLKKESFVQMIDETLNFIGSVSSSNRIDFENKISYFSPLNLFDKPTKNTIISTKIEDSFDVSSEIYKALKEELLDCDSVLFGIVEDEKELIFKDTFYTNSKIFKITNNTEEELYRIYFLYYFGRTSDNMNSVPHLQLVEKYFSRALNYKIQYKYNGTTCSLQDSKTSNIENNLSYFILNLTKAISGEDIEMNIKQKSQTDVFKKCLTNILYLLSSESVKKYCETKYNLLDFESVEKFAKFLKTKDVKFFENVFLNMGVFESYFNTLTAEEVKIEVLEDDINYMVAWNDLLRSKIKEMKIPHPSIKNFATFFTDKNLFDLYDELIDTNSSLVEEFRDEQQRRLEEDELEDVYDFVEFDINSYKKLNSFVSKKIEGEKVSMSIIEMNNLYKNLINLFENLTKYFLNVSITNNDIENPKLNVSINNIMFFFHIHNKEVIDSDNVIELLETYRRFLLDKNKMRSFTTGIITNKTDFIPYKLTTN